jgi:hypothetical protein
MGMYTEFYFRANLKDGPVTDWLERQITGEEWFETGFDDHEFFTLLRWSHVFTGGGAVYQESRQAVFRRKGSPFIYDNKLVVASSLKNYGGEIEAFIEWIGPHLDMPKGDFLGYSLYEDTHDDNRNYREHPNLYFAAQEPVTS